MVDVALKAPCLVPAPRRIVKLVRALRRGWIKREGEQAPKEAETYLMWDDDLHAGHKTSAGTPPAAAASQRVHPHNSFLRGGCKAAASDGAMARDTEGRRKPWLHGTQATSGVIWSQRGGRLEAVMHSFPPRCL